MRTTLTLDDDVAALLERVRAERRAGLKDVVNDALRLGLRGLVEPPRRRAVYRTEGVSVGRCLVGGSQHRCSRTVCQLHPGLCA